MRIREDCRPVYVFGYVDEAGTAERYFGCGLLIHGPRVSGEADHKLNAYVRMLKTDAGMESRGDVGWKKVPSKDGAYLGLYRRYVEGFFRHPSLSFNAMVVDTTRYPLDSREFFRGSKDKGIDAFVFQLIKHRLLPHIAGCRCVYVRYDRRSRPVNQPIRRLRGRLVRAAKQRAGADVNAPELRLRSVVGGRHPLLHVTDLLLGCVVASLNRKARSQGKLALLKYLEDKLGRPPGEGTSLTERKFSVWRFEAPDG